MRSRGKKELRMDFTRVRRNTQNVSSMEWHEKSVDYNREENVTQIGGIRRRNCGLRIGGE